LYSLQSLSVDDMPCVDKLIDHALYANLSSSGSKGDMTRCGGDRLGYSIGSDTVPPAGRIAGLDTDGLPFLSNLLYVKSEDN
jgi:hypothetical protein